ncbi:type I restriction enzyme S subunit [Rhodobacter sp. 140A]|nr:type I restriction enzyme S subunit [Rhodobacter sp. 140A]
MSSHDHDWSILALADVVRADKPIVYGIVQAGPECPGGVPYIKSTDVRGKIDPSSLSRTSREIADRYRRSVVRPGDIVFSLRGNIGELSIVPPELDEANLTQGTARISVNGRALNEYVAFALREPSLQRKISRLGKGSTFQEISLEALRKIEISLPPLPEQRKIAEILRTWDEAIERLEALRAAKLRRITSVRQRLFEAAYASHNRLQRARDIFEPVSERARPDLPLLAVMQDIGIVRRDELDRRVAMPDGDTSSYKVVRPGDFVISLRSFEGGLEYSTITGLVSPAYTVLRPTTELVGDYYRHFFKSRSFIGRLDKLIFGIRDGKQIAFRDFGDMHIPAPPASEQKAQTDALGCLEADLALENDRIEALTRQKRGLMQKLLTGEWRVSP